MRTIALLTFLTVAGCSSSNRTAATTEEQMVRVSGGGGGTTQIHTTATTRPRVITLEIGVEEAWRALPAAYAAAGIEIARSDAALRVIGNPGFRVRRRLGDTAISRYLDCGNAQGGPSADSYEVHFSVLSELSAEAAGRTTLTTVVDAVARPVNFSGDPVRCFSKGVLETRIANAVTGSTPD